MIRWLRRLFGHRGPPAVETAIVELPDRVYELTYTDYPNGGALVTVRPLSGPPMTEGERERILDAFLADLARRQAEEPLD